MATNQHSEEARAAYPSGLSGLVMFTEFDRRDERAAFDRGRASGLRQGWAEGHEAGHADYVDNDGTWPSTPNPYDA